MLATTHQIFGITWGLWGITFCNILGFVPNNLLGFIIFFINVLIGSLVPDIDTPNSRLGRKLWLFLIIVTSITVMIQKIFPTSLAGETIQQTLSNYWYFGLLLLFSLLSGHRKFTHSIIFLCFLGIVGGLITHVLHTDYFYLIGFLVGVFAHLVGDYLTVRGIPLLYPFSDKYYKCVLTFTTGSFTESFIAMFLVLFNIEFAYFLYQNGLLHL